VWLVAAAAAAEPSWGLSELRPFPLGPALAVSPSWDGGEAWFSGGPDGLVVFAPDGTVLARTDVVHPRALLVHQLDGAQEPEVVACGPEGIALVRGARAGLSLPRPLTDEPCDAIVAYDLERWPGLASVSGGELVRWTPTGPGLVAERTGVRVPDPRDLAALGSRLAVIAADGSLRLSAPDERVAGPMAAVGAARDGFRWVGSGDAPAWSGGGPLDGAVTGLVASADRTWFLDEPGRRVRTEAGPWISLPLAPARGLVVEASADGCPDLLLVDAEGIGAVAIGRCGASAPSPASAPAPPSPPTDELAVRGGCAEPPCPIPAGERPWSEIDAPPGAVRAAPASIGLRRDVFRAVDVRAGEVLSTRVGWGDGRAWRWSSRGGPPGFSVQADGTIEYEADASDIGRWRASVRSRAWPRSGWSGVEVRVWPAHVDLAPALPTDDGGWVAPTPRTEVTGDGVRAWVGFGVAGGVATVNGSRWESLGQAPTGGGASPFGLFLLETRLARGVDVVTGFDAAPLFSYPSAPARRSHVFATTAGLQVGSTTVRGGVYGTWGYTVKGLGGRVAWTPWVDGRGRESGLELRATWLAPQIGGEATFAWLWRL
jgi:hypothetical protein